MLQWLLPLGTLVATVVPVLLTIRFSTAARLRRKIDTDQDLLTKLTDPQSQNNLKLIQQHQTQELLRLVQRGGPHWSTAVALLYVPAGATAFLWSYQASTKSSQVGYAAFGVVFVLAGLAGPAWRLIKYVTSGASAESEPSPPEPQQATTTPVTTAPVTTAQPAPTREAATAPALLRIDSPEGLLASLFHEVGDPGLLVALGVVGAVRVGSGRGGVAAVAGGGVPRSLVVGAGVRRSAEGGA